MTGQNRAAPVEIYRREDPNIDPPAVGFGLGIERRITEGDVVLFVDDDPEPARSFELHRIRGAFRITDGVAPLRGCFASAQAAIRDGWAMINPFAPNPFDQFDAELPSIADLLTKADPTEEGA